MTAKQDHTGIEYMLYISAAAGGLGEGALTEILTASRRNNAANNITGLLLFDNRNFVQLLEGKHEVLANTFAKIKSDTRHSDVTVISSGLLTERCFPGWEMGFKAVGTENKKALDDFIGQASQTFADNQCELPVTLLQAFFRNMK